MIMIPPMNDNDPAQEWWLCSRIDLPVKTSNSYMLNLSGTFWFQIDQATWKLLSKWSEVELDAMSWGSKVIGGLILEIIIFEFWLQIWIPCTKIWKESVPVFSRLWWEHSQIQRQSLQIKVSSPYPHFVTLMLNLTVFSSEN